MTKKRDVLVRIGADDTDFQRGVKRSEDALDELGGIGKKAGAALAAGFAAATAATAALTAKGLALADRFDDVGKRLGVSAGVMAELSHVARMSGMELGDLEQGLTKLAKRGAVEQQLTALADKMASLDSHTERTRLAVEVFGERAGPKLVPLLADGAAGLAAMREEARKLGLTLTDVQSRQIAAVNDALDRMKSAGDGVALQLTAALAPALTAIADVLQDKLGGALDDSGEHVITWGETVGDVIAFTADAATGAFKVISATFESSGKRIGAVAAAMAAVVSGEFSEARTIWNEFGADQDKIWGELANNANFTAFRDKLEEVRRRTEEFGTAASTSMAKLAVAAKPANDALEELAVTVKRIGEASGMRSFDELRQAALAKLDVLRESYADQFDLAIEKENERHAAELAVLSEAEMIRAAGMEKIYALREQAEEAHQERTTEIQERAAKQQRALETAVMRARVDGVMGHLTKIANLVANESKKAFKFAQGVAAAEASLDMYRGIAAGVRLGWPQGIAAVAWATAEGLAAINAIKNTQFGGGTTPSAAGTPTVNGNPVQAAAPRESRTLILQGVQPGLQYGGEQVRELMTHVGEWMRDGGKIVLV